MDLIAPDFTQIGSHSASKFIPAKIGTDYRICENNNNQHAPLPSTAQICHYVCRTNVSVYLSKLLQQICTAHGFGED